MNSEILIIESIRTKYSSPDSVFLHFVGYDKPIIEYRLYTRVPEMYRLQFIDISMENFELFDMPYLYNFNFKIS